MNCLSPPTVVRYDLCVTEYGLSLIKPTSDAAVVTSSTPPYFKTSVKPAPGVFVDVEQPGVILSPEFDHSNLVGSSCGGRSSGGVVQPRPWRKMAPT